MSIFRVSILLPLAAVALFNAGCGSDSSGSSDDEGHIFRFSTDAETERAVRNFVVLCDGPCPQSNGALIVKKDTSLYTCSFSLVGPDIILTNRHCIPDEIAKVGASCSQSVLAIFQNGYSKEEYVCDKVLSFASEYIVEDPGQRDFAFLKLKNAPRGRQPLRISREGLKDKETLTALTSTPMQGTQYPTVRLTEKKCTVHMNSMALSSFTNGAKPLISMKNCDIVSGNSGSALVSSSGEVKGVVQARYTHMKGPEAEAEFSQKLLDVFIRGKFAMGTNILCVENAELNLSPGVLGCDTKMDSYSPSAETFIDQKALEAEVEKALDETNKNPYLMFKLSAPAKSDETTVISFEPDCIKGSKESIPWLAEFKKKGVLSIFDKYPKSGYIDIPMFSMFLTVDVDDDARLSLAKKVYNKIINFVIPVKEVASHDKNLYEVTASSGWAKLRYQVPLCGNR